MSLGDFGRLVSPGRDNCNYLDLLLFLLLAHVPASSSILSDRMDGGFQGNDMRTEGVHGNALVSARWRVMRHLSVGHGEWSSRAIRTCVDSKVNKRRNAPHEFGRTFQSGARSWATSECSKTCLCGEFRLCWRTSWVVVSKVRIVPGRGGYVPAKPLSDSRCGRLNGKLILVLVGMIREVTRHARPTLVPANGVPPKLLAAGSSCHPTEGPWPEVLPARKLPSTPLRATTAQRFPASPQRPPATSSEQRSATSVARCPQRHSRLFSSVVYRTRIEITLCAPPPGHGY